MRIRALTLIVLVIAWMVPTGGASCPSDARDPARHTHTHSEAAVPGSHDHAVPGHADGHTANAASCCQRATDSHALQAALQDAKPRPKLSVAALPALLTVSADGETSVSSVKFRRQPPPPLPYAGTRRPLLI